MTLKGGCRRTFVRSRSLGLVVTMTSGSAGDMDMAQNSWLPLLGLIRERRYSNARTTWSPSKKSFQPRGDFFFQKNRHAGAKMPTGVTFQDQPGIPTDLHQAAVQRPVRLVQTCRHDEVLQARARTVETVDGAEPTGAPAEDEAI